MLQCAGGEASHLRFTNCINSSTVQTSRIHVPQRTFDDAPRGFRRSVPKTSIEGPMEPSACMEDQSFTRRPKGGTREDDEGLRDRRPWRSLRANTKDTTLQAFWEPSEAPPSRIFETILRGSSARGPSDGLDGPTS
jgi:hypothetical protein